MSGMGLSFRERFRRAGQRVLQRPTDPRAHLFRIRVAARLPGAEPLQGALADMLSHCDPDHQWLHTLLDESRAHERLPTHVIDTFVRQAARGQRLPRVNSLATRWCVLAMPSLDVPARAQLCSVDDSRDLANHALPSILAGNEVVEREFLDHCEGASDTVAFMLARRRLHQERRELSPRWLEVAQVLQHGGGA